MRKLSDTIARLAAMRAAQYPKDQLDLVDRLSDRENFGSNPGLLKARAYVPARLPPNSPLVVVLHGCTQSAAAYDHGSGWSALADAGGFAVLFPEQTRANNPNLCFNWFEPRHIRRGQGEVLSIRQMIADMVRDHDIDETRIFITGLSAGGAMTSAMLAAYPELFASGAIVAGLPYGVAGTVPEAFDRMRGHGGPSGEKLAGLVLGASDHKGPWPTISVWHGTADQTVSPSNASDIVEQWRGVHALPSEPSVISVVDGHKRRIWRDFGGRDRIELFTIEGMGHGTPLQATGADALGASGPFMLDRGISSTRHIARFWGIAPPADAQAASRTTSRPIEPAEFTRTREMPSPARWAEPARADPIRSVIETALRQAGLMK
ncbi:PHB depolymerase family esterase [Kaistia dalseonensis]|uniref:Poly(Hydroxyalkanoate) depolymerase family esterase n=1 Tax=Kaistia dalseonensis TaxID=410840 RepID=A0ABU0H645_9HYPH|nr:PHB depolymerase family esterase [Kaistia dalseonensis]MCX5494400.1 PHB depolymerase family esterase [Kaistia dalseonensis]MDQ0436979.1 poly(hydroxyalkanoate) depolymerase family esterase [Kaistia dalseonensis]